MRCMILGLRKQLPLLINLTLRGHNIFHSNGIVTYRNNKLKSTYLLKPVSDIKQYYSTEIDQNTYEKVSEETLDSLTEYLEDIIERDDAPLDCDVTYSSGVLTLNLGEAGTYVINKQSPNKQIWLSSPLSGPKRYEFIEGVWVYKHDGIVLHRLLQEELSAIFKDPLDLTSCEYAVSET